LETQKDIVKRLRIVYLFACLLALIIMGRAISIGVFQRDYWIALKEKNIFKTFDVEAVRGNIISSDGSLLAMSVPIYTVRMDLKAIAVRDSFQKKVDSLALRLSQILPEKSKETWKRELRKAYAQKSTWFLIANNIEFSTLQQIRTCPILRYGRYKGGRIEEVKTRREMPFRSLAERTLGRYREGIKPVGIEGAFNDQLKGVNGKQLMRKISGGIWRPVEEEAQVEARNGDDIITTIDVSLQDVAEAELRRQLEAHKAEYGCVVLMEVETGYIKAIANLGRSGDSSYAEIYNYALGTRTEPGSTYKLASLMAAFEDGLASPTDIWDTKNGVVLFGGKEMIDSKKGGYGKIDLKTAFEESSNTAISQAVNRAYQSHPEKFIKRLKQFHLHETVQTDLPGEEAPKMPEPEKMKLNRTSVPWLSIGYETAITPLQLLTFFNAVANDGKMMKPQFVQEIRRGNQVVKRFDPIVIDPAICSKATIEKVKPMLEGVVSRGTATRLKSDFYQIAGKTGTAQVYVAKDGYKSQKYQASFAGYFPADDPKYSCIVVIFDPTAGDYYGSKVAAPVFKEVGDKVYAKSLEIHSEGIAEGKTELPARNIRVGAGFAPQFDLVASRLGLSVNADGDASWVNAKKENKLLKTQSLKMAAGLIPDVTGMGLKDALYLLENAGLRVTCYGKGLVKKQSLPPGTKIQKNSHIIIELT
jgi:cell division protein FtsI (penicillin-binding protein 3)